MLVLVDVFARHVIPLAVTTVDGTAAEVARAVSRAVGLDPQDFHVLNRGGDVEKDNAAVVAEWDGARVSVMVAYRALSHVHLARLKLAGDGEG